MASRRDQLNAYTFARKRTVAAFLQPSANGSEEGAPRPMRSIVPSLAVAALLVAGFGGWGLIKPSAAPGWNTPYANVLVGSESTTRYVVLKNAAGVVELHPVLNMASARLLLKSNNFSVIKVDESLLDSGKPPIGPTVGIPYAPDRLPAASEAGSPKYWAVCERKGGGSDAQKAVFVLDRRDPGRTTLDGAGKLRPGRALYVTGPGNPGTPYLIAPDGTAYPISTTPAPGDPSDNGSLLLRLIFGDTAAPQQVTADWLRTFHQGTPIAFPDLSGFGRPAGLSGLPAAVNRVGMVISAPSGSGVQDYVVLPGKVAPVSKFVAHLLMNMPEADFYPSSPHKPVSVPPSQFNPSGTPYLGDTGWPAEVPRQANLGSPGKAPVSCSVYRGTMDHATPELSVWSGDSYPVADPEVASSAYVTPGSGLLYRQVTGTAASGGLYLVTDTGLRYNLPGGDSAQSTDSSAARLGYGEIKPQAVPADWSAFLPVGPTLDSTDAAQEQGS
jgi:type VII secretion protein EccB